MIFIATHLRGNILQPKSVNMPSQLHMRLKNCLQTILELETDMSSLQMRSEFESELETLKEYLSRIEQLSLAEDDVLRLERATANFLEELRIPLAQIARDQSKNRILQ